MRVRNIYLIGLIVLVALFSYFNTFSAGYVWDDLVLIVQNPYVKSFRFLPDFLTHDIWKIGVSTINSGYYRPLLATSFMVDYAFWKDNPLGFHLTNLIFHILICALIFIFLKMLIRNRFVPFVASLIFAAHSIHTESVSFISGRVDLIAFFFMLLSLILYFKDRQQSRPAYYLVSCSCFFLALLNKEMAVTLPLLLVSLDYLFISKEGWRGVRKGFLRRYSGYFIAFVLYLGLRSLFLDWSFIAANVRSSSNFMPGSGHFWRLFTAAKIFAMYLRLLIFPYAQSADYFFKPASSLFEPLVMGGVGAVFLLAWLIFKNAKKDPAVSFALSWLLITVLPVINLVPQGNVFAERYMYIPSLGFCLSMGLFFYWLLNIKVKTNFLNWKKTVYLLVAFYIIALGRVCFERNKVWENDLVLWFETSKVSPNSPRAHMNLSSAFYGVGELDRALVEIKAALRLYPTSYDSLLILGQIYLKQEKVEEAIQAFRYAISIYPDRAGAFNSLAVALGQKGQYLEAIDACKSSLKINPYFDWAIFNLALNYSKTGQEDMAIEEFKRYLTINPSSLAALTEMGKAYIEKKEFEIAKVFLRRALKIDALYKPAQEALQKLDL